MSLEAEISKLTAAISALAASLTQAQAPEGNAHRLPGPVHLPVGSPIGGTRLGEAPAPSEKAPSLDDVRRGLKALGIERGLAILKRHGVSRVTDLAPEKFGEVLAEAQAEVD